MASHVWSEADIVNRTEAMVRSVFNAQAEDILSRKATGALLGQYALTPDEQAELARFAACTNAARAAGIAARADMALLAQVLPIEAAARRLVLPVVEPIIEGDPPTIVNQAAVDADAAEREAAMAIVDAASEEALELFSLRAAAQPSEEEPA